jgi:hypothetical protein
MTIPALGRNLTGIKKYFGTKLPKKKVTKKTKTIIIANQKGRIALLPAKPYSLFFRVNR